MSSYLRASRLVTCVVFVLLLAGLAPVTQAGGLRVSYHDGNWAASVRLGSSWNFRCAPGLVTRHCGYYPRAYGYGYGSFYPGYAYDYGYTGYIGEYYGVRYLSSPSSPASAKMSVSAPADSSAPTKSEPITPSATDADTELKQVLAEISAERTPKPATEAEMDPRIVVPEALASMVGLPEIQPMAFKKVRR